MPSLTYLRTYSSGVTAQIFGYAKDRTAWTIYNTSTAEECLWSNNYMHGQTSGFKIPSASNVGLKVPEDDPRKEVFIRGVGGGTLYIYEGFADNEFIRKWYG